MKAARPAEWHTLCRVSGLVATARAGRPLPSA